MSISKLMDAYYKSFSLPVQIEKHSQYVKGKLNPKSGQYKVSIVLTNNQGGETRFICLSESNVLQLAIFKCFVDLALLQGESGDNISKYIDDFTNALKER